MKAHGPREPPAAYEPFNSFSLIAAVCSIAQRGQLPGERLECNLRSRPERKRCSMLLILLIVVLVLVLGGGGGYYGHRRWGYAGGGGIGLGTVLLILVVCYLLGMFH